MAQPYRIVGVEGAGCHPRLELRDLQKKPIQFSLFIRALAKLQEMRNTQDKDSADYYKKPNSWWQLGGIHGLPYEPWSGDPEGPQNEVSEMQWGGYCYHGEVLFPPWHRVLLLLVEQAVVDEAIAIATELEANDCAARAERWVECAKGLRFPFWDWTKLETAEEGIPKVCQEPSVTIVNPGGSQCQVANPLNHYKFAASPGSAHGIEYMDKWNRTYRWADRNENPTREEYEMAVKAFSQDGLTLQLGTKGELHFRPVKWLRDKVAALFTYDLTVKDPALGPNMWAYFSNTRARRGNKDGEGKVESPMSPGEMPSSLEESHNTVHIDVGGNGCMSANEYAGFDPIFFLHHCNVDRIYAFWEYLYPEYWIGNGWKNSKTGKVTPFETNGTFVQNAEATIDHSTPLHPFRNKASHYWTADDARGLLSTCSVNKYYTYPPIVDPRTCIKVQVDAPYDVNNVALREQYQQVLYNEWGQDLHSIAHTHWNLPFQLPFLELLLKVENEVLHLRQFVIVGQLPEFAFSGSYRLELYFLPKVVQLAFKLLKQASGNLRQEVQALVETATYTVNNITVLGRSDPERCAACKERRADGSHTRGYMHLDPRLILYMIASLDSTQHASITELDHLSALIEASLGMRLVKPDGTTLAVAEPDTTDQAPLHESKLPKLSIHSHVIQFNHTDPTAGVHFGEHVAHGTFGESHGWFL